MSITEQQPSATGATLTITKERLRAWKACQDGYGWFIRKFPSGAATYQETQAALRADDRRADSGWLCDQIASLLLSDPSTAAAWAADFAAAADEWIQQTSPAAIQAVAQPFLEGAADGARIGSSGDGARIGSSGDGAQIGSSGDGARIGSSGYGAQIGSSGNGARIGSSGDGARINAAGANPVVVCAGCDAVVRAGESGAVALTWHDGTRSRISVGYVGEGLEPGIWYRLDASGAFVAVDEEEL